MQKLLAAILAITCLFVLALAAGDDATLRGSPASMERQHGEAVRRDLAFVEKPAEVEDLVKRGKLVPVAAGADYQLASVSFPFAQPEVRAFIERISYEYRKACGEPLTVTSLTRPQTRQPGNAHALSVHPAGMAVDFRVSRIDKCRDWLESELLGLEREDVLDITRERNPPHYHVAVFPAAYTAWAARQPPLKRTPLPEPVAATAAAAAPQAAPAAPAAAPRTPAPPAARPQARMARDTDGGAGSILSYVLIGAITLLAAALLMSMLRRMRRPTI
jgi:hypothetical protein